MATLQNGQLTWGVQQDREGYRVYKIKFRVIANPLEGPASVLATPGLPAFGSFWVFDGDSDVWAWCTHECSAKVIEENAPNFLWEVEKTFTTKPPDASDRPCKDTQVEDPLLEPPKVSGAFTKNKQEATSDRFANPILNSAFEQMRGPQVEFDDDRQQVKIELNVLNLDKAWFASYRNRVNAYPLWGMDARCVKLSEAGWEIKFYGACSYYHTVSLTFDLDENTFDRDLLDEGSKVLNGHWDPATGEWVLDDVGAVAPPGAPTLSKHVGGTLAAATYNYKITTTTAKGETAAGASAQIVVATTGIENVKVEWTPTAGATGYKIYRSTGAGAYGLVGTVGSGLVGTFTDTGGTPEGAAPPSSSTAGGFEPDPSNPAHFIRWKDPHGENMRGILNGAGQPASLDDADDAGKIHVEYYDEADFLEIGIPVTI